MTAKAPTRMPEGLNRPKAPCGPPPAPLCTVWLLIEQTDYEGQEIHSLYSEKPLSQVLYGLLKDSYGYAFDAKDIKKLALTLYNKNEVYFLNMVTWRLEERYVNK